MLFRQRVHRLSRLSRKNQGWGGGLQWFTQSTGVMGWTGGMGALRLNRFLCNDGFKRAGKIMLWSGASTATGRWKRSRVAFPAETRLIAAATVLSRVVVSHWFFLMQVLFGSSASFKSNCVLSGGPSLESNTQHMCYALKTASTALLGFILRRICLKVGK